MDHTNFQEQASAVQSTSPLQFRLLSFDDPIPTGYSLTTCRQAEHHKQRIRTECSLPRGERIRLKNGYLSGDQVVRKYRRKTKFKLVSSTGNVERLTEGDVLIQLAYAGDHDDPNEVEELVQSKGTSILNQKVPSANFCALVHICACNGSIKTLNLVFEKYAQFIRPEDVDGDGDNALHDLAPASKNVAEAASIILNNTPADVVAHMLRQTNARGLTPLHKAIVRENESMCAGLLSSCATHDLNWLATPTHHQARDTALHLAVRKGYIDVVKAILAFPGVEELDLTNKANKKKERPLHVASWLGHAEICAELLTHGARINIKDAAGRVPITNAFLRKKFRAVEVLLDFLTDNPALINERFQLGFTALHIALTMPGRDDTVHALSAMPDEVDDAGHMWLRLLRADASVDVPNDQGKTPLHIATEHLDGSESRTLRCKLLLNRPDMKSVDRKHWVNMQDLSGHAAIHNVVKSTFTGIRELMTILIANGAFVDLRNSDGETPLHIAARNGHVEVVELLLSNECLYNSKGMNRETWITMSDFSGQTALHEAARTGQKKIVKQLLESTIDRNNLLRVRDTQNRTALHWAVQNKDGPAMVNTMMRHAQPATKLFLLWNELKGTASQVPEVLKSHVPPEPIDAATLLKAATEELQDLDMATELINSGADVRTLKPDTRLWLSRNLRRKASDQPAWEDSLGRRRLVHGIAALLLNPYTGTPITIGIFGDWGTGKSSFMLQVEATLLQMAVKEIFRKKTLQNTLSSQNNPLRAILRMIFRDPREKLRSKVNKALQRCMPRKGMNGFINNVSMGQADAKGNNDFIDAFEIQSEYPELLKDLALTDSSKLLRAQSLDHPRRKRSAIAISRSDPPDITTTDQSIKEAVTIGLIPSVLIVRYDAWHYENKAQASAGLAVEISRELECNMTPPQWLRMYLKYSWKQRRKDIFMQLLLPIFVALVVVVSIVIPLWTVTPVKEYKLLSLPIGIVSLLWVFSRTLRQLVQPVAQTIQTYIQSPDHTTMLGYHQRVIDDIKFLKEELCEEPGALWKLICIFRWVFFCSSYYMKGTRLYKQHPQKDNLRIVVFIDDLDRCEEKTILELLCAVNLILAMCEINVVLGVDKGMVERAISKDILKESPVISVLGDQVVEQYAHKQRLVKLRLDLEANDIAEKYMQKIIQLPVQMPDPSDEEMKYFLKRQIGRNVENIRPGEHKQGDEAFHLLLANYSPMETDMLLSLCNLATREKRFPRELKRFLNYHRLAWSILSLDSDMKKDFKGWQRKLILWIFICWNWREQMDEIIENWDELLLETQKLQEINAQEYYGSSEDEISTQEYDSSSEDESSTQEYDSRSEDERAISGADLIAKVERKRTEQQDFSLGDIISVHMQGKFWKQQEENDDNNRPMQESASHRDVEIQKKWRLLYMVLKKEHDIKFDFIEKFQDFRFLCKLKHLERDISM